VAAAADEWRNAMTPLQDGVALLGRLLLALLFLLSGFQKLTGFGATVASMGQEGLLFLLGAAIVAIVVECVGGVALVLGYQTRLTGAVLAVWYIASALAAHVDFSDTDEVIHFLTNVAMAGGFLQLVAFGAGNWSLDSRRNSVARLQEGRERRVQRANRL
jgi:putative oxidoreductase